jgi:hypothetical protein
MNFEEKNGAPAPGGKGLVFGRSGYVDVSPPHSLDKADNAVLNGEDGIVAPEAHTLAGVEFGAALPNDDIAREHRLTGESLYTEPFAFCIATVPR